MRGPPGSTQQVQPGSGSSTRARSGQYHDCASNHGCSTTQLDASATVRRDGWTRLRLRVAVAWAAWQNARFSICSDRRRSAALAAMDMMRLSWSLAPARVAGRAAARRRPQSWSDRKSRETRVVQSRGASARFGAIRPTLGARARGRGARGVAGLLSGRGRRPLGRADGRFAGTCALGGLVTPRVRRSTQICRGLGRSEGTPNGGP